MSARRGWWRRLVVPLMVCAMSVAMAGVAVPSATAAPPGAVKTVPVQQLSNRVLKLIKTVEDSPLACSTRNAVVRGLRVLDDALLSGRRSAARAFAQAWTQHAWSLESGRVLSPELGSALQTQLGGMVDQIGFGWPVKPGPTRHWKPLPSCDSGVTDVESSAGVASGACPAAGDYYTPFAANNVSSDIEIAVGALVSYVPVVGNLLYALTYLLWPAGSTTDSWDQMACDATHDLVSEVLGNLKNLMTGSAGSWNNEMTAFNTNCPNWSQSQDCQNRALDLWTDFQNKNSFFIDNRGFFQAGETTIGLDLLPLFAQYETMYMSFLRDGMLLHDHYWDALDHDADDLAGTSMFDELNPDPTDPDKTNLGVHYVDTMYNYGLDDLEPSGSSMAEWNTHNYYIRTETLTVLDSRDTWKYLDPRAYPGGVPGGVKLTRMIYSDVVGYLQNAAMPTVPSNVAGPLKEISVWTKRDSGHLVIGSVQATNPPLMGPAESGVISGDTAQWPNHTHYYDLAARGPISEVKAQNLESLCISADCAYSSIGFVWARDGTESSQGDKISTASHGDFAYDGEVLATALVTSSHDESNDTGYVATTFVFGFRYADSFDPAGEVIGAHSGKCIRLATFADGTQAEIYTCNRPAAPDQIWTYDPGLQQISVTQPPVNPADNPTKYCLDAAGGGTSAGTPVVINATCDDGATTYDTSTGKPEPVVSSQRWAIDAVGADIGKITNVKSGLVVDVYNNSTANGTLLQLYTYSSGNTAQQWRAADPLTGEIHGIGSGRCVDVPGYSTAAGTQVQIYDCHGGWNQQWTYNPMNKELIYAYAPSLCLTARGGGTAPDTWVEINTCTGAAEQRWTLHGNGDTITNDKSGLPLSVPHGYTANGTLLNIDTANGAAMQQWSRTSTLGGALYAVGAGKCLDLGTSGVVIHSCASPPSVSQTWTYHPIAQTFTVNTASGAKCLDAAGGGTTEGTAVVINDCTPGAASQRWTRDFSNETITNVNSIQYKPDGSLASAMVLSVTGTGTADGTTVQLTQSVDANGKLLTPTSNQKWVWSLS